MTWEQNPLTSDARAVWGTATAGKIQAHAAEAQAKNHRPTNYNLGAGTRARAKKGEAGAGSSDPRRPPRFANRPAYCPNRRRYSSDVMKALTISALTKSPSNCSSF